MTIRLLITARDAAAALHLTQVALVGRADPRFHIEIAAQEPAARYLRDAGLPVRLIRPLSSKSIDAPEAAALREVARDLLAQAAPDIVMTGLSTPFDAGLDEAVLLESHVPTVLFQDFWGEQNLLLGKPADHILAVDDEAVRLNRRRYGVDSIRVGSARHAAYSVLNGLGARSRVRARLGVGDEEPLIGFFGQALHQLAGYGRTVDHFIKSVAALPVPSVRMLVRSHPREDFRQREATEALFAASGLSVLHAPDGTVEEALMASDVSCSLFSTCTYDAAYLNRFAVAPVTVPVSMLFDPEIVRYCEQHVNLRTFPYHKAGAVLAVHDRDELGPTLERALGSQVKQAVWQCAHAHLPDPVRAPALTLDAVADIAKRDRA